MKTKDLIQKINGMRRMNANVEKNMIVVYENGMDFSFYSYPINGENRGDGYTNFANIRSIYMKELFELLDLIDEYRQTPESDREGEKLYRLRYDVPPLLRAVHAKPKYLYIRRFDGYKDITFSQADDSTFQKIFTESEIAQMDITGFEKEPVE